MERWFSSSVARPRVGNRSREPKQVIGGGAGEAEDRLIVVADDADVVARAEPQVQQRLLQRVHVLVLVDGEGLEARPHDGGGLRVTRRTGAPRPEQVLEVDRARSLLAPLVARRRRAPSARRGSADCAARCRGLAGSAAGRGEAVLRPLDLAGELASGAGTGAAAGARWRARRARAPSSPGSAGAGGRVPLEAAELGQRRRVERPRLTPSTPSAASRSGARPRPSR